MTRFLMLLRKPKPEPVDDFRDVLEDLWLNREARKAAEARNRLQFDMESDQ